MPLVFLVEDNPQDVELFQRAIQLEKLQVQVKSFLNGQTLLNYFRQENVLSEDRTQIMFLDIDLPDINGLKVLEDLQSMGITVRLPIVILSSSDKPKEVDLSLELGAAQFIQKPVNYQEFRTVLKHVLMTHLSYSGKNLE